jgi:hypothetical protein
MTALSSSFTLRRILGFDALTCLAMGLLCLAGAAWLEGQLAIPAGILRGSGLLMLGCAAFIGWLASRTSPPRPLVWLVIAGNVLWALESLIALMSGWLQPNAAGTAFVIGQALAVLAIAELEYIALRRQPRAA